MLETDYQARHVRLLTLEVRLPWVPQQPQQASECPMLDENVQFSLDGEAPSSVVRGGFSRTGHEWSEDTTSCGVVLVTFVAPMKGGRLPLRAWSPDGEASMVVSIPPAHQPTIVAPKAGYDHGETVRLEIPSAFLRELGLEVLPTKDVQAYCAYGDYLCFQDVQLVNEEKGLRRVSSVGSDATGISVYIPQYDLSETVGCYLTYIYGGPVRKLSVESCEGFASCSGHIGPHGLLAPVTLTVN